MTQGHLFVISGPSGAGKGTLVRLIEDRIPDLWLSVSATTRSPREGEVEGREYFFLSNAQFDDLIENDGLLEWAEVHGNRYGTPRAEVERRVAEGAQVILEIDPQGALQVREHDPEAVLIFIMPPSREELERRLRGRGTESEEQISCRLGNAADELALVGTYDYVVLNADIITACDELVECISTHNKRQET